VVDSSRWCVGNGEVLAEEELRGIVPRFGEVFGSMRLVPKAQPDCEVRR